MRESCYPCQKALANPQLFIKLEELVTQLLQSQGTIQYSRTKNTYMAVLAPLDFMVSLKLTLGSLIDAHRMAN